MSSTATAGATDVAQAGPLSDVPRNSWAYDAVDQLAKDGIIKGYPDGTFKGNRPMTRYEAAVLAYRAVDMIEAQITAGKAVEKSDIDAANKLIAAYGAELKAVERHVDALQQEADATKNGLAATDKRVSGQAGEILALNEFDKKAYIKYTGIFTGFAYGGNINANCGPGVFGAGSGGAGSVGAYCAAVGGGNALLPGVKTAGFGNAVGAVPPAQSLANGQKNSGVGFYYQKISLTGTPTPNTAFLVEFGNSARPAQANGTTTDTTAYCIAVATCTPATAGAAQFNNGEPGDLLTINNTWIQQSIPNSGIYLRAGHVQNNMGPTGGSWLGGDYYWGAMLGMTKGNYNGYIGYGFGDNGTSNTAINNVPYAEQNLTIESDYTFGISEKANINIGAMYWNYTGFSSSEWDPSAVMCTGAAGASKLFANTAAVPFTTCGVGFTPITYANGAPITGSYLSAAANNNPGGATPGLAVSNPISEVGADIIFTYGNARLYLAGTYRFGNDPYTGAVWKGNTTGDFVFDLGPFRGARGNRGKWTYEAQGFAAGFNAMSANNNYFGGPILDNSWNTNFGSEYWVDAGVKYWVSDGSFLSLGYGRAGLLPNTSVPAGGLTCPGCAVTGFGQNAAYLQMNLSF